MDTLNQEALVKTLERELDSTSRAIHSLLLIGDRMLNIGIPVLLGICGVALKEKVLSLTVLLPFVLYILLFYWLDIASEMVALGGYRCYLEERINGILGTKILLWESSIAPARHSGHARLWLTVIYAAALSSFIAASLYAAAKMSWRYSVPTVALLNGIFLFGVCTSFLRKRQLFSEVYRTSTEMAKNIIPTAPMALCENHGSEPKQVGPEALSAALNIQWQDFFQNRQQTWKALQTVCILLVVFIAADLQLKDRLAMAALVVIMALLVVSGIFLTVHHRSVQIDKFSKISELEKALGLANLSPQGNLPSAFKWHDPLDVRRLSTPLFVIRCYLAILVFLAVYFAARLR